MSQLDVIEFGAKGDGVTLDTSTIQAAIDSVHAQGGGTVTIPGGKTFLCSGIELKSNVHLYLEPGSVIRASITESDYAKSSFNTVIEATNADNISITGFGRIEGCGSSFIKEDLGYIYDIKPWRPGLVFLLDCRQVTLRDVSFHESPWWTVHLVGCQDVLIDGIHINNDLKMPNCDGIDPDHCQNVRISNCHIQCADDCIVFKNTHQYADRGPCRDITVTGCTLMCTATAIKIGSESVSDFENISISNCTIKSSSRGFGIQLRDQGNVRNVIFSDSTIETRLFDAHYWGKAEPVHISATRRFKPGTENLPDWNRDNRLGTVRNVLFSNLLCKSENGIVVVGEVDENEDLTVHTVVFRNVILNIDKWTKWPGGELDLRPVGPLISSGIKDGKTDPGVTTHPFSGVYLENAAQVTLDAVMVDWASGLPDYYEHALEARNAKDLRMEGFRGEAPNPLKHEAIVIH
ncbi:MAG: glycoside hydrolase family 28 protein [Puniceicoccaceae bacterium]